MRVYSCVLALMLCIPGFAVAQEAAPAAKPAIYPLATCPVGGEKLGEKGEPVVKVYDGREVRFCSEECAGKFEADKETFLKKIDEQIIAEQKDSYPTVKCVVMPEDEIDPKLDFVMDNRLVRVCCRDCIKDIKKEPAKYMAEIDKAVVEKQGATYPLTTCLVSDEPLGEKPVDYVSGTKLVRLCCKGCVKEFEKNPTKYLSKLDAPKP